MFRPKLHIAVAALILLLVAIPCAVFAQPGGGGFRGGGPGGPGGPGGFGGPFGGGGVFGLVMREDVQQELQLLDEQQEKVRAVGDEMRTKIQEEMRDMFSQMGELSEQERQERFNEIRTRMESINADMEKRLKKVLLPHQFDRLKQIDLQTRVQTRGASALTSGELAEALNLTDQQREKLERRAAEVEQELQEQIQQLRLEARNKIFDVLTAEQRTKLETLMGDQFQLQNQGFGFGNRGGGGGFGGRGGGGGGDRGERPRR